MYKKLNLIRLQLQNIVLRSFFRAFKRFPRRLQRDKKSTGRNRVYTFELKWNVLPQVTFTLDNMENSTNIFLLNLLQMIMVAQNNQPFKNWTILSRYVVKCESFTFSIIYSLQSLLAKESVWIITVPQIITLMPTECRFFKINRKNHLTDFSYHTSLLWGHFGSHKIK